MVNEREREANDTYDFNEVQPPDSGMVTNTGPNDADAARAIQAANSSKKNRHTVLFLAVTEIGTDRLLFEAQARAIQEELERSGYRDHFEFVTRWAVQPMDMLREIRRHKPTVVHFCGPTVKRDPPKETDSQQEADAGASLSEDASKVQNHIAHDPTPASQFGPGEALGGALGAAGSSVQLVVLSTCYTDLQATALIAHVACVVGTVGSVKDITAREFAVGFYGGLGERESVGDAFKQGQAAVRFVQPGQVSLTRMLARQGIDLHTFYIIPRPPTTRVSIVIKANFVDFDAAAIARIRDQLRLLTDDLRLEIIEVQEGSVRLTIQLSVEAASRLKDLSDSGNLFSILGENSPVIDIESPTADEAGLKPSDKDDKDWRFMRAAWLLNERRNSIAMNITSDFVGAKLNGANFSGVNLTEAVFVAADLMAANLSISTLTAADLSWADLSGADLLLSKLDGAKLKKANLEGANLEKANLERASLEEANLGRASLKTANLRGANLQNANLVGANLLGANLAEVKGWGCNLERAEFPGARLTESDLSGANLRWAELEGANLKGAKLVGSNLEGVNLRGANLAGANIGANLAGSHIGANRSNSDLPVEIRHKLARGSELGVPRPTILRGANLEDANLYRASLVAVFLEKANLRKATLVGASLESARLPGANLEGANLREASLIHAHLEGTKLAAANFAGAHLAGVHLEGANLQGASFDMASLTEAQLEGANLEGANLSGANLSGANLSGANLTGTNLQRACLEKAKLFGADMRGAKLVGADLRKARLEGAKFAGANLTGANLDGADLNGADLLDAIYSQNTRWPDGFSPPTLGNEARRTSAENNKGRSES